MGSLASEIADLLPEAERLPIRSGAAWGPAAERVDSVRRAFRDGYLAAAAGAGPVRLRATIATQADDLRVFAYEGAGMALAVADLISPPAVRLSEQLAAPGFTYGFLGRLGAGWALARLRRPLDPALVGIGMESMTDVADGYGFFDCCFRRRGTLERHAAPAAIHLPDFDRGVGRGCWFMFEGSVDHIRDTITAFPEARRDALWKGVGFAATFIGGVSAGTLVGAADAAAAHETAFRSGAAKAVYEIRTAGDPAPATQLAMSVFGLV